MDEGSSVEQRLLFLLANRTFISEKGSDNYEVFVIDEPYRVLPFCKSCCRMCLSRYRLDPELNGK